MPGVLADEHCHVTVLEVAANMAAEQVAIDPEFAGFLLGQGAGAPGAAQHPAGSTGVGARQVVTLAATTVVENLVAAVLVPDRGQPLRDFANRRVPVDFLEAAVSFAAQRAGQAIGTVLVVIEAGGLLAEVTLGCRVGLVTANADDLASVLAAGLHLDTAIALAENTGAGLPLGHNGLPQVDLAGQ